MTRNWCTQADKYYNHCQDQVVEGRPAGQQPDTVAEGYGTICTNYYVQRELDGLRLDYGRRR